MSYLIENGQVLEAWIEKEISFPGEISRGSNRDDSQNVQEWLNLHEIKIAVDGDFGPATEDAVKLFQEVEGLNETGVVDAVTYSRLVQPMIDALTPPVNTNGLSFQDMIIEYAQSHLIAHPREVGGANRGPWVRLYMNGNDGPDWLWCAGFVTFIMRQAAEAVGMSHAINGSFSCDQLAQQGKDANLFMDQANRAGKSLGELPDSCIFLVRRSANDWTHTGIVTSFDDQSFYTIEGNTNDEGHREGDEVCARMRGYADKDFILV